MQLRTLINKNPGMTAGVGVGVAVVALVIGFAAMPATSHGTSKAQKYYSIDGGKSYFTDEPHQVVPFQKEGKEAVGAVVYKCGGNTFVGYLYRSTDAARQAVEKIRDHKGNPAALAFTASLREFKKPGGGDWSPQRPEVTCSNSDDKPTEVLPPGTLKP